jgi:hypothetical protein
VNSPPDEDGLQESDLVPDFLEDLASQLDRKAMHLKIFLQAQDVHVNGGIPSEEWWQSPITWPQDLQVIDACLTNASSVWIAKHCYL